MNQPLSLAFNWCLNGVNSSAYSAVVRETFLVDRGDQSLILLIAVAQIPENSIIEIKDWNHVVSFGTWWYGMLSLKSESTSNENINHLMAKITHCVMIGLLASMGEQSRRSGMPSISRTWDILIIFIKWRRDSQRQQLDLLLTVSWFFLCPMHMFPMSLTRSLLNPNTGLTSISALFTSESFLIGRKASTSAPNSCAILRRWTASIRRLVSDWTAFRRVDPSSEVVHEHSKLRS